MAEFGPQTAIRGVFSVGVMNLLARVVAYGKHLVIAAYIGLSAGLDAFFMATAVLSIVVFVFGDMFDSVGIPRLVATLSTEGEERFRKVAGSILAFAFLLSAGLCAVLLLAAPWAPAIAPGFSPEKKELVIANLLFLAPMAFLYLPYHALGSFLRARRRFQVFYVGELLVAFVSFAILVLWHDARFIIPVSFSAAYVVGFGYVAFAARGEVRVESAFRGEALRGIVRLLFRLLPTYAAIYLFVLVDRVFASYLETGGVSALSYGIMIVSIPASILMLENVFVTPLAESAEKGEMMRSILVGSLILSVPAAFFITAYAGPIVRAAFERGVFTAGSTRMTGDALAFYALALPVLFVGPVCVRLFQVLERLGALSAVYFSAVALNALLNLAFMKLGMGVKGIALASSIAWYASFGGYLLLLRRFGIAEVTKGVGRVALISAGIGLMALGATWIVPLPADSVPGLLARAAAFLLVTLASVLLVPDEEYRRWRDTLSRELLGRAR